MKTICFITSSRADYGILSPLISRAQNSPRTQLQIIALGTHLSPEFGNTVQEILVDGYKVDRCIENLMSSDTAIGVCKSFGLVALELGTVLNELHPDIVVLLGDRYEMVSVAMSAVILKIPIAHIHGGEQTIGANDDAFRHAITKLSTLHFPCSEVYKKRIIQMGEPPNRVFNYGALGIENIKNMSFMERSNLEESLDMEFMGKIAVVTYHPTTYEAIDSKVQMQYLLSALDILDDYTIIFTYANADTQGRIINQCIDQYVQLNPKKCKAFASLGKTRYLSLLAISDLVIGNSSSGILEAPFLDCIVLDIGQRQSGRLRSVNVIHTEIHRASIEKGLQIAINRIANGEILSNEILYGDGDTSSKILSTILMYLDGQTLSLNKEFYNVDFSYIDPQRK